MTAKIKLSTAKIVGPSNEEVWSQVFFFDEDYFENIQKKGSLFGILTVKRLSEEDPGVLGKNILGEIEKLFAEISNKNNLEVLKEIVGNAKNDYCQEIILGFLINDALYLAGLGGGKAFIKRGDKIATLLNINETSAIESISGLIKDKDLLALETAEFGKIIDPEKIKEAISTHSVDEISDILAPQILNSENNSLAAAIFVEINKEEEIEQEEVVIEEKHPQIEKEGLNKNAIVSKIKIFFQKLPDLIKIKIPRRNLVGGQSKNKRPLFTIAFFLLILFAGSIFLSINKQKATREKSKIEKTLEEGSAKYEEGKSLVDLNQIRAKTLLEEAKKTITETQKDIKKGTEEEKKLSDLEGKIDIALSQAIKIYKVKPNLFYDLTMVKDKGEGTKLSLFQKNLLVLDQKNISSYLIGIENKTGEIVAGGDKIKGSTLISFYGDIAYFLNSDKGISEVDIKTKSSPEQVIEKDKSWGEIIGIFPYGGNLYLLDKKNNQIWKYIKSDSGFSEIKNYLTEDTKPDFTKVVSFAIDGSVWILKSDGEILKFTQGRIDNISTSGLDKSYNNPRIIYTNDELKNIYVLDKGNKRIVVFEKTGKYNSQYESDLISNVQDFVSSEELKKIFLLEGSKIYSIDLK